MTDAQTPLMRILPTHNHCERQVRLDRAGKPVYCGKHGFGVLVDGTGTKSIPLCKTHLEEQMDIVELAMNK